MFVLSCVVFPELVFPLVGFSFVVLLAGSGVESGVVVPSCTTTVLVAVVVLSFEFFTVYFTIYVPAFEVFTLPDI